MQEDGGLKARSFIPGEMSEISSSSSTRTDVAKANTPAIRITLQRASELCGSDLADRFLDMVISDGWGEDSSLFGYVNAILDPNEDFDDWLSTLTVDPVIVSTMFNKIGAELRLDPTGEDNDDLVRRVADVSYRLTDVIAERELLAAAPGPGPGGAAEEADEDGTDEGGGCGRSDEAESGVFELRLRLENLETEVRLLRQRNYTRMRALGDFLDAHTLMPMPEGGGGSGRVDGRLGKLFLEFCGS